MFRFIVVLALFCISIHAQNSDKQIVIVGAGLSGYSAARKLIEGGYSNIVILEALNRIGGRIYSVSFAGGKVDLGAQWIHGQTNNIIHQLTTTQCPAISLGSTPFENVDPYFMLSDGTFPPQEDYSTLYKKGYDAIESVDKVSDPQGKTFLDIFHEKYEALVATLNIDPVIVATMKEELYKNIRGYYAAESINDISAKVNYDEKKATGDQHVTWKKLGYATFFDVLSKKCPTIATNLNIDGKVQLNKKVTSIQYNPSSTESKVTVTCADATTYQADHVIFTGSLGYLKAHHTTIFNPALPVKMQLEINSRGIGNLGKFFMEFSTPFWKKGTDDFLGITGIWKDSDKQIAVSLDKAWTLGIVAVYGVDGFPNVLEVFLAGNFVQNFEITPTEKVIQDIKWWLEKFAPYTAPVPDPLATQRTKWMTDEIALGSYTYPSMGEEKNNVRTKDLAVPITDADSKPIVLLAGEATDENYPSMAHGAVSSGFRVAQQIIDYYTV